MINQTSWPRLRAILDEAIQTERGVIVHYDTWTTAELVRAQMYKIRDMQRRQARKTYPDPEHPSYNVSAYDGLTFWLRSSVKRTNMTVHFHNEEAIEKYLTKQGRKQELANQPPADALAVSIVGDLVSEPESKKDEKSNLFPGECVTVSVETEDDKVITVSFAPNFQTAWRLIRNDFPCDLVIENGYSLTDVNFTVL